MSKKDVGCVCVCVCVGGGFHSELQGHCLCAQHSGLSTAGQGCRGGGEGRNPRAPEQVPDESGLKHLCAAEGPRGPGRAAQERMMPAEMHLLKCSEEERARALEAVSQAVCLHIV